jgi:hypothetical protein
MTGPEHYIEAEHLLDSLGDVTGDRDDENNTVAIAQVHATLALAAATAAAGRMSGKAAQKWDTATGVAR